MTDTMTIIGAGNMGASLLAGLIGSGFPPEQLWITDPDAEKLRLLKQQFSIQTTHQNEEAVTHSNVIILAVKPQILKNVLHALAPIIQQKKPLIISVAAGIREKNLRDWAGGNIA